MPGLGIVLNPTSEGHPVQLDVNDGAGYRLMAHDCPPPPLSATYAGSADTEGEIPVHLKYGNRKIRDTVRVYGSSAADLEAKLAALSRQIGQFNREGGTYKRTSPAGTVSIFDVLPETQGGVGFDPRYLHSNRAQVELDYTCKPFWRGTEVSYLAASETTLPVLIFTVAGPAGDVPALGRLVVNELQGQDQWRVDVAVQSRHYSGATTAALIYQAEDLTPTGGSALVPGPAGSSGGGANRVVVNSELSPTWLAMLRSPVVATGLPLTHKGGFRLKARVYRLSTTGTISLAAEWAEGDYRRPTRNAQIDLPANGRFGFVWVDLGLVHIRPDSDRWEFRILGRSTLLSDEINLDCVALFPTTEGYVELSAAQQFETPTSFVALDGFDQSAGALTGKTTPAGLTWTVVAGSDADDFQVEATGKTARRTAVSDAIVSGREAGRLVTAGIATQAAQLLQVDMRRTATALTYMGVAARVVDSDDFVFAGYDGAEWIVHRPLSGGSGWLVWAHTLGVWPLADQYTVRFVIDAQGRFAFWAFKTGGHPGAPVLQGQKTELATGGALATGKYGLFDAQNAATANTRDYDNFFVATPTADAAMFASQSLELRHDRARREDPTGTFWTPLSKAPRGRYLTIPPAGRENRSTRLIVKGYRNDPDTMADAAIDDISAQLFVTPRGLAAPQT